jgi:hypothetical protein
MIKQSYDELQKSNASLQKEIGIFLFDQYKSFLSTTDGLEKIKNEMEDIKTTMSQYHLVITSFKG